MKTLHVEFDCIVTDADADGLLNAPECWLKDNIMEALEITDDCEDIVNFKIEIKPKED